jgi:hypothetical protein
MRLAENFSAGAEAAKAFEYWNAAGVAGYTPHQERPPNDEPTAAPVPSPPIQQKRVESVEFVESIRATPAGHRSPAAIFLFESAT